MVAGPRFDPGPPRRYLNNREFAHYRSEFKDDETRKRHLVRLWFREQGRPFYDG